MKAFDLVNGEFVEKDVPCPGDVDSSLVKSKQLLEITFPGVSNITRRRELTIDLRHTSADGVVVDDPNNNEIFTMSFQRDVPSIHVLIKPDTVSFKLTLEDLGDVLEDTTDDRPVIINRAEFDSTVKNPSPISAERRHLVNVMSPEMIVQEPRPEPEPEPVVED